MRHRRLCIKLPLLLPLLSSHATAAIAGSVARERPLRISFDSASLPTMYADAQGSPAGIYPSIVRTALTRIGEPAQLLAEPFRRLVGSLLAGSSAAGAVVRNSERLAVADYSADYYTEHLSIYQRSTGGTRLSTLDELRGLRVGVIRGWSYGDSFDMARDQGLFQAEEVDSDAKNFAKLQRGRLDVLVATELAGRMLVGDGSAKGIVAGTRPLITIGIALAIPKRLQAQGLLQRFDEVIAGMRRERLIDAIVATEIERARKLLPVD